MLVTLAAAVAALAQSAYAANAFLRSLQVAAGSEIEVFVYNATDTYQWWGGERDEITHFKLVLESTIFETNICSLTDFIPAKDGIVKVKIPPYIAPSGRYYSIRVDTYTNPTNKTIDADNQSGSTPYFYLTGSEVEISPMELTPVLWIKGLSGLDYADIPCPSYSCALNCANKHGVPILWAWDLESDYIKCLEDNCKDIRIDYDYLEGEYTGTPTTTYTAPTSVPTFDGECREDRNETKCGTKCCGAWEYCVTYKECKYLDEYIYDYGISTLTGWDKYATTSLPVVGTGYPVEMGSAISGAAPPATTGTGEATGTGSGAGPEETGAASLHGVEWGLIGAVALGGYGLVGLA